MTTITDIRRCGPAFRRRTIVLDGDPWRDVPSSVVAALGIEIADRVDLASFEARILEVERPLARARAIRLLTSRDRSHAGLLARLVEDGFALEVAEPLVADLERIGLVDDERFAHALARTLAHARSVGRAGIALQLRAAGVEEETASAALEDALDAAAESAAARHLADAAAAKPGATLDRIVVRLVRRGYRLPLALSTARDAFDAIGRPTGPLDAPDAPFQD